jgi:ABC-type polysaccharide/polyol phosphate export permease
MLGDLLAGLMSFRIWWGLALLDIKLRYRRTVIGPIWVTMSFMISAIVLSVVFSTLFHMQSKELLAYIVVGLAVWTFMVNTLSDSCNTFIRGAGLILEKKIPLSTHAYRLVARNVLLFGHNMVAVIIVLCFLRVAPTPWMLFAIPSLLLIIINGFWLAILLGLIVCRFRDMQELIIVALNVAFFVTPVFWKREMLGTRVWIADINPLYHFLVLLRSSILGYPIPLGSWCVPLSVTVALGLLTLIFASRHIRKVGFWL